MTVKIIAPYRPTKKQREWLDNECVRTGEAQAVVLRRLIQKEIDNG